MGGFTWGRRTAWQCLGCSIKRWVCLEPDVKFSRNERSLTSALRNRDMLLRSSRHFSGFLLRLGDHFDLALRIHKARSAANQRNNQRDREQHVINAKAKVDSCHMSSPADSSGT